MPTEPGPSAWALPDPALAEAGNDIVAAGADLAPATLLAGYRAGLFPMADRRRLLWFSPDPRGVLPAGAFRPSRSLVRSARRYEVSVDEDFEAVLRACADPRRPGAWISKQYARTYRALHALGWAHSVEVWSTGEFAGGLLGVEIGGLFCGETMVRLMTDASKVALWATVAALSAGPDPDRRLFDVQWLTPHLRSLGAVEVPRAEYLRRLRGALDLPPVLAPSPRVPAHSLRRG